METIAEIITTLNAKAVPTRYLARVPQFSLHGAATKLYSDKIKEL